jgi:hypothetical protein
MSQSYVIKGSGDGHFVVVQRVVQCPNPALISALIPG